MRSVEEREWLLKCPFAQPMKGVGKSSSFRKVNPERFRSGTPKHGTESSHFNH